MRLHARQGTQPFEPLLSECVAGSRRHLRDRGPQGLQMRRLRRKLRQRFRSKQHFIRIAQHARPAQIADAIHDLHRSRAAVGQIATVENQVGRSLPQIRQDRLERGQVAVDVGYDGDARHDILSL